VNNVAFILIDRKVVLVVAIIVQIHAQLLLAANAILRMPSYPSYSYSSMKVLLSSSSVLLALSILLYLISSSPYDSYLSVIS